MGAFFKTAAGVLIAAILCLVLAKQSKDYSVLIAIVVCGMVMAVAMQYLKPVFELLRTLSNVGQLDGSMLRILYKSVGIAMLAEIVSLICTDSGNGTLGKAVQILAAIVILFISTPLFTNLIELIEEILSAA